MNLKRYNLPLNRKHFVKRYLATAKQKKERTFESFKREIDEIERVIRKFQFDRLFLTWTKWKGGKKAREKLTDRIASLKKERRPTERAWNRSESSVRERIFTLSVSCLSSRSDFTSVFFLIFFFFFFFYKVRYKQEYATLVIRDFE